MDYIASHHSQSQVQFLFDYHAVLFLRIRIPPVIWCSVICIVRCLVLQCACAYLHFIHHFIRLLRKLKRALTRFFNTFQLILKMNMSCRGRRRRQRCCFFLNADKCIIAHILCCLFLSFFRWQIKTMKYERINRNNCAI